MVAAGCTQAWRDVIPFLLLVCSYLIGAIPNSYLAGRLTRGIDLRKHGSGNLGTTNVFRVLGARVAVPVLLLDILKGWVPAFLFPLADGWGAVWGLAYGAAAIIGHVFPVYLRFRGGKGVATGAGVFLALAPIAVLTASIVWIAVLAIFRIVSLASLAAAATLVVALLILNAEPAVLWLGIAVAAFVVYAHRANVGRLLRGEELRFGRRATPLEATEKRARK